MQNSFKFIEFPSLPELSRYVPTIINTVSSLLAHKQQIVKTLTFAYAAILFSYLLSGLIIPGSFSFLFGRMKLVKLEAFCARKARESTLARLITFLREEYKKRITMQVGQLYHAGIF